ncbi:hypothetical protein SUDANB176_03336 [Streptomyces sp. enrichment culture]|uniref:hypothetical protein n=1 Tax=Streptomyces sp. enrichment culture TaxID=1795815 RepID=UPI003F57B47C
MFSVAWGVFATAFGWIVATDFRGAAHRFHALSHTAVPFGGGASGVGVGFLRVVAGVFALVGPLVLAGGLLDLWRGGAGPDGLPPVPARFAVLQVLFGGVVLWWMWRRSGLLRREWDAGTGPRRAAVAGLTASVVAFTVTLGFGWGTWAMASWLVGCPCALTLLLSGRTDEPSDTGPAAPSGSSDS